jgi:hypothetical protein
VKAMRRDQETKIQGLCESVESHLFTGDARPAYKALLKLRSSASTPRCPTVRAADGAILSDEPAVKARWAGYFEELYRADPPDRGLPDEGVTALDADPPASCAPPTVEETRKAVVQLKDEKAAGVCGMHAEMLKTGGDAALSWLHTQCVAQ